MSRSPWKGILDDFGKGKIDLRQREEVIWMNMCMLTRGNEILALDKEGRHYRGTTFPGGHVEKGETFAEAVIREVEEETGYRIEDPILRGIYHWYREGAHHIGLLYRAEHFRGELRSSEEGKVYWITREEYEKKDLAQGMRQVLQIMWNDCFSECFMEEKPDGSVEEKVF